LFFSGWRQGVIEVTSQHVELKIALVIASLRGGGAERVLATLAAELAGSGHDITVFTESGMEHDHYQLGPGIRRVALDIEWETSTLRRKLAANIRRMRRLRDGIVAWGAQRVIVFGETTNLRALMACSGTGIPVIVSERVDPRQHRIPRAWRWLRRGLYPRAAAVVVQTESVAQWARSFVASERVHVIANPVRPPLTAFDRPALLPRGNVIIAIGRLIRQKGFPLLIEAFSRSGLPSQGWYLVILGEGPDRRALQEQVRQLGLRHRVGLPGLVALPEAWLQHADLFVLSSLFEGFPNALLEAMACGVASVAFDCPSGPAEIIRHERSGLLLPAGDVAALAAALADLASDPPRRERLAQAARTDVAARFQLRKIVEQWQELLESVSSEQHHV
jgi:glycosyltransferase involved in cell wall biosynthesis